MPYSQQQFDKAVWDIVLKIKPGRVLSYGEVARAAGYPRHARMVSKALGRSRSESNKPVPWYRVVRSDRTLAFEVGSEPYNRQKRLLEKEGVQVFNGKVIPVETDDLVDLDKLLWGPGESQQK